MKKDKKIGGYMLHMTESGNVQVYGKRFSRRARLVGDTRDWAWRLAFEATPGMIESLHAFILPNAPK